VYFLPFLLVASPFFFARFLIFIFILYRVKGERYFECRMNYGVFVRPEKVKVGDYPVLDINFDDEEM
jgi:hypothetical protein